MLGVGNGVSHLRLFFYNEGVMGLGVGRRRDSDSNRGRGLSRISVTRVGWLTGRNLQADMEMECKLRF